MALRTSLPRLIVSRTIWSEWTRPRWSPLAWCRMSIEHIVGTCNLLATLVTLPLQLWNLTGTALGVRHGVTKGAVGSQDFSKGHEWACLRNIEFGSTTSDASWTNTQAKQGCNCPFTKIFNTCNYRMVMIQPFCKTLNHSVPVLFIASFIVLLLFILSSFVCFSAFVWLFRVRLFRVFFLFWYWNCQVFQSRYSIYNNYPGSQ